MRRGGTLSARANSILAERHRNEELLERKGAAALVAAQVLTGRLRNVGVVGDHRDLEASNSSWSLALTRLHDTLRT